MLLWGAAIAQWIRLRLPSCCPGFDSQACHLCLFKKKKRKKIGHFSVTRFGEISSHWQFKKKSLTFFFKKKLMLSYTFVYD